MDYFTILANINTGLYKPYVAISYEELLPEDTIIDRSKNDKWNREEVLYRNNKILQARKTYDELEIIHFEEFKKDLKKYIDQQLIIYEERHEIIPYIMKSAMERKFSNNLELLDIVSNLIELSIKIIEVMDKIH